MTLVKTRNEFGVDVPGGIKPVAQRMKVTTMKKLLMLTAAAGILLALAEPTLAAKRGHRGVDAYASTVDRSGPYYYGPSNAQAYVPSDDRVLTPSQHTDSRAPHGYGQNLPYPDRPYGAPDSW